MSNASEIRKTIELVAEAGNVAKVGVDQHKNVVVNIETLARETNAKGKYDFNKGFLTFRDIIDAPASFIEKYRKESRKDTSRLVDYLKNLQVDAKFTDKEKYLREGYEARGYSNGKLILVWWKDKKESLFIFAPNNTVLSEVRDFMKFFGIIR